LNSPSKQPSVGFVGVGVTGAPMVSHLHKSGYLVTVHDLDANAAKQLAKTLGENANAADTPREAAGKSDIVITMLPNGNVVQEVTFGEYGLAKGFKPGALLLDTSSAEPWLTQQTAKRLTGHGVAMVDAPVSGAQWGAEAAELVFMAGGTTQDLERVRPLLGRMGRAVFHLGALGGGPCRGPGRKRERASQDLMPEVCAGSNVHEIWPDG
jgi:3-hydroxyisobutyrate dehydrogenase-like beta-hydroxyacid dehydrogenase